MKYTHIGIVVYTVAIVGLVKFSELPHRGGCRDNRVENCVAAKDDGGYVPPNNGSPDSQNGTGTRYK
ncbi:MAG: hypothetical protein V7K67_31220 [Nostoc sp.]|uniref:hypothetical protein n=1 Tax=Nostoc sp. TaxID=1180 RepID=UPI002FF7F906